VIANNSVPDINEGGSGGGSGEGDAANLDGDGDDSGDDPDGILAGGEDGTTPTSSTPPPPSQTPAAPTGEQTSGGQLPSNNTGPQHNSTEPPPAAVNPPAPSPPGQNVDGPADALQLNTTFSVESSDRMLTNSDDFTTTDDQSGYSTFSTLVEDSPQPQQMGLGGAVISVATTIVAALLSPFLAPAPTAPP
jgi:hypothetical protein